MSRRDPLQGAFRSGCAVGLLLTASGAAASDGVGADEQLEALRQQLQALQVRVDSLEARLDGEVNAAIAAAASGPQPVEGGWRKAHNWSILDKGMGTTEVATILGEPQRQKTVSKFEYWFYGDGKVRFYLDRLKSWETPGGIDP